MMQVTCGIIVFGSQILAVQRGPNSSHPIKWEFPGGKLIEGETPEACILRELREELQVEVSVLYRLHRIEFEYPGKKVDLIPFVCEIISGTLTLTEHLAKCWFNLENWQTFDWAEADYELIRENYNDISRILSDQMRKD